MPCLDPSCTREYSAAPGGLLSHVLPPKAYERMCQRMQSAELKAAQLEGLTECPFCW